MLTERINAAIGLLQGFTAQKTKDGELTEDEIEQMLGELDVIKEALQYELECRQEACMAAAAQGKEARTEI